MSVGTKSIFETKVREIGKEAQDFKSINMLIFFGPEAPSILKDSCFIIDLNDVNGEIKKGMTLRIGDHDYLITNLKNLGHIAVRFTGDEAAELPGSLYVEKKEFPNIKIGTRVTIY